MLRKPPLDNQYWQSLKVRQQQQENVAHNGAYVSKGNKLSENWNYKKSNSIEKELRDEIKRPVGNSFQDCGQELVFQTLCDTRYEKNGKWLLAKNWTNNSVR